jgi:HKD family nuclease
MNYEFPSKEFKFVVEFIAFGIVTLRFPFLFDASGQGIQKKEKENKENSRNRITNILRAVLPALLLIKCRQRQYKVVITADSRFSR